MWHSRLSIWEKLGRGPLSDATSIANTNAMEQVVLDIRFLYLSHMGLDARNVFRDLQTTKVNTSLCSLISAFVFLLLKCNISTLATSGISIF